MQKRTNAQMEKIPNPTPDQKCPKCGEQAYYWKAPHRTTGVRELHCSAFANQCPYNRRKVAERVRKRSAELNTAKHQARERLKKGSNCYMCGKSINDKTGYVLPTSNHLCCSPTSKGCPKYHETIHEIQKDRYRRDPSLRTRATRHLVGNEDVSRKKSIAMKRLHAQNKKFREKYLKGKEKAKKTMQSDEMKQHLSEKGVRRFKTKRFRKKYHASLGSQGEQTRTEKELGGLLNYLYPELFKFNENNEYRLGQGIFTKKPDFYSDLKLCVNFNGLYWHGKRCEEAGISREQYDNEIIAHYANHDHKILIIWEDEMHDAEKLIQKIRDFVSEHTLLEEGRKGD